MVTQQELEDFLNDLYFDLKEYEINTDDPQSMVMLVPGETNIHVLAKGKALEYMQTHFTQYLDNSLIKAGSEFQMYIIPTNIL